MKRVTRRLLAFVLTVVMLLGTLPVTAAEGTSGDPFRVIVSLEGLTLGQGLYVEPKSYSLDEINTLIATEGYGPYKQDELTAGMATLAFLIDQNLEYNASGSWDSNIYLQSIKGIDDGNIDIPEVITENGGPSNEDNDGNEDEYLGEMDYSMMAGWMITVNNLMIPVGASQFGFEYYKTQGLTDYLDYGNTYVVRWQFTLYGYGADLGIDTGWGMPAYFDGANKSDLYIAYADATDATKKAAAKTVLENLTATQTAVDSAVAALSATELVKEKITYSAALEGTLKQLADTITEPAFGTSGGEWTVLTLARGGYYDLDDAYFEDYYSRVATTIAEKAATVGDNKLHKTKSTENSRAILALTAIGKDVTNVNGVNLLEPLNDFTWVTKQGLNGPVFALLAADSHDYEMAADFRENCIEYILGKALANGGWAFSGSTADPDMTAMALQALAKYSDREEVALAAADAFQALSDMQKENGGFASWGTVNSESIAQVIVAACAWYINPAIDDVFVKENGSAVDALLEFYVENSKAFAHVLNGENTTANAMATDQAAYALVAFDRFVNEQSNLYDMTDVEIASSAVTATLDLPENIENKKGETFNAIINLSNFPKGYRLADAIVSIPEGIKVNALTVGERVKGGTVQYYLEEATGKLRIAYLDAQAGTELTVTGTGNPVETFVIECEIDETLEVEEITMQITGMTFKKTSSADTQLDVDISKAYDKAEIVEGITFTAMKLYTGDGVDLIPTTKSAIVIAVTGVNENTKISFQDSDGEVVLRYNAEISAKTGVASYVAMVNSSKSLEDFAVEDSYTVEQDKTADNLVFGDLNGDGLINAQDALKEVNYWLRKETVTTDLGMLQANVNADSRINTLDVIGIVEKFADGLSFEIINKAATIKSALLTK